jgi:hypothetical protein
VRDERRGNNKPKKRKNTESREIREIFANGHMCRRDANEKRQHVSRKKAKQKNFSRFFSLSLSLQSFLVHTAFGRRYESYLINLFLLQEERFHDERRREKGKFRSYYIYIIASSSNRFPRFRRSVLRVRVRVREREHVWICLFSPPPKEEAEEDKEVLIR